MVTINLTQLKRKKKRNGEIPIYLRFTQNRKSRYLSTGIAVKEKHWNPREQSIRKSHPTPEKFNDELQRQLNEAKTIALQIKAKDQLPTTAQLKQMLSENNSYDFFTYAEKFVNRLHREGRYRLVKQTNVLLNKLRAFIGDHLPIFEITSQFLGDFQLYLKEEYGNAQNTISKDFERFSLIMKAALDDGVIDSNPFDKFGTVKRKKTEKEKLSPEQIEAIQDLELEKGSELWHTRNYFLFSFYNAGIRFSDLCRLKWGNIQDGRLKYQMGKTGGYKNIKLLNQALEILEHYRNPNHTTNDFIFPILPANRNYSEELFMLRMISSRNVLVNRNLKKIGRLAGIETPISFHVSRHSFADYARTKGMSVYDISKALAHNDIKTTEAYLKSFDEVSLDSSMEELFQ